MVETELCVWREKLRASKMEELLREVSAESSTEATYQLVTVGEEGKKRWQVSPDLFPRFWKGYCELVWGLHHGDGEEEPIKVPREQVADKGSAPVVAHLIFRFEREEDEEAADFVPYGELALALIVAAYQATIGECYALSDNMCEYLAVVLESGVRQEGAHFVAEVRIQFPYARISVKEQNSLLRNGVLSKLRRARVSGLMGVGFIENWDTCLQKLGKHLPLCGEMSMTHVWTLFDLKALASEEQDADAEFEDVDALNKLLFVENHQHFVDGWVEKEDFEEYDDEYCLPIFLSASYYAKELLLKPEKRPKPASPPAAGDNIRSRDAPALLTKLAPMLARGRFRFEPDWNTVGQACYAAYSGSDEGLALWVKLTKSACGDDLPAFALRDGALEYTAECLYSTFCRCNTTVKSVAWMAAEDNPLQYNTWHHRWCKAAVVEALSPSNGRFSTDNDVAEALYRRYWLEFAWDAPNHMWYQFKDHRWKKVQDGITLTMAMSEDFAESLRTMAAELARNAVSTAEEAEKDKSDETNKRIWTLIQNLRNQVSKSRLLKESKEKFWIDGFSQMLDLDFSLLGVQNGVLVAHDKDFEFRAGRPEDYITMFCPVKYDASYTHDHPKVRECNRWLGQVFPDAQLLDHFKKLAASMIKGGNKDKIFPIFTGNGDNSKSMIIKLFEATLGPYCIKFPPAILTENPRNVSGNGATPVTARAKGTRAAFVDEPEDDVPMHKGVIKRMTGGDTYFARMLNENGGDVKSSFVLILVCNNVPVIPHADAAIKKRTRVYPFLSKWLQTGYPETEEEQQQARQFPQNTHFADCIPSLAPAFLWIACNSFSKYRAEGLNDPQIVKDHTQQYWDNNDSISHFTTDCLRLVKDEDGKPSHSVKATIRDLHSEYKIWHRLVFPSSKPPDLKAFRDDLIAKWGIMDGNGWYGVVIANEDGDAAPSSTIVRKGGAPPGGSSSSRSPPPPVSPSVAVSSKRTYEEAPLPVSRGF